MWLRTDGSRLTVEQVRHFHCQELMAAFMATNCFASNTDNGIYMGAQKGSKLGNDLAGFFIQSTKSELASFIHSSYAFQCMPFDLHRARAHPG